MRVHHGERGGFITRPLRGETNVPTVYYHRERRHRQSPADTQTHTFGIVNPTFKSFRGENMSNAKKITAEDVAEIVANPKDYGFEWFTDNVAKGDNSWTVPLVRHLDVDLLRATFGDRFFLDSADGTSRHVTNQRIARDIMADNATAKPIQIQTAIVENMLGQKSKRRTVVETPTFPYGGVVYKTVEEMKAAATADLTEKGYPADLVKALVDNMTGVAAK